MRNIDNALWDTLKELNCLDSLKYKVKTIPEQSKWKICIKNNSNTQFFKVVITTNSYNYVTLYNVYDNNEFTLPQIDDFMYHLLGNLREPNEVSADTEPSTSSSRSSN